MKHTENSGLMHEEKSCSSLLLHSRAVKEMSKSALGH